VFYGTVQEVTSEDGSCSACAIMAAPTFTFSIACANAVDSVTMSVSASALLAAAIPASIAIDWPMPSIRRFAFR